MKKLLLLFAGFLLACMFSFPAFALTGIGMSKQVDYIPVVAVDAAALLGRTYTPSPAQAVRVDIVDTETTGQAEIAIKRQRAPSGGAALGVGTAGTHNSYT